MRVRTLTLLRVELTSRVSVYYLSKRSKVLSFPPPAPGLTGICVCDVEMYTPLVVVVVVVHVGTNLSLVQTQIIPTQLCPTQLNSFTCWAVFLFLLVRGAGVEVELS